MKKLALIFVVLGFGVDAEAQRNSCRIDRLADGSCKAVLVQTSMFSQNETTLCSGYQCACSVGSQGYLGACSGRTSTLEGDIEKLSTDAEVKASAPTAVENKE
jgi:hypothetical protein